MQRRKSFGRSRFAFGMMCGETARTDNRQMLAPRRRCTLRLRLSNLDCKSGQFDLPQLWTKRQQRTRQQGNKKNQNRKQNSRLLWTNCLVLPRVLTRCCDCCCLCCCQYRVSRGCVCFSPLTLSYLAVLSLAEHFGLICIISVSRVCSRYLVCTHTRSRIVRDGTHHLSKG